MSVRIGVLRPLEVRDAAGNIVPVGGARMRSLLIRLAIDDGRPAPAMASQLANGPAGPISPVADDMVAPLLSLARQ
jgi:hypothetical protein